MGETDPTAGGPKILHLPGVTGHVKRKLMKIAICI